MTENYVENYELFEIYGDNGLFGRMGKESLNDETIEYKIRLICLFRISGTNKWIMKKMGAIGKDKEKLIGIAERTIPKVQPKEIEFKIFAHDLGVPYETDDDGVVLGDWPVIGTLSFKTDKVIFVRSDDIVKYDLFMMDFSASMVSRSKILDSAS